jgi:hypothetical protein
VTRRRVSKVSRRIIVVYNDDGGVMRQMTLRMLPRAAGLPHGSEACKPSSGPFRALARQRTGDGPSHAW